VTSSLNQEIVMRKSIIALSVCMAAAAPLPLLAQGEVGAVKQAPRAAKASADERAAGKAQRNMEGRAAIKEQPPGEVGPVKQQPPVARTSRSERKADRASTKAETAQANKAGELPTPGLVGPTK
jgi:hypothetical protein